ncbi:MAG: 23S rRNA (uracil(1939)-C(5))-methyltransferase RlmD [Lachnospiraceae bacterium]|nr:23S rRNA (uracil(1939)-C(5))-methyltransferase RlmD [Lachnospiraceae bacterium]
MSTTLVKNDLIELSIEDYGNEGEGVAKHEGFPLFINGALKGEKILAKVTKTGKSYGYARVEKVLEASPHRVEPKCQSFKRCGGCSLLHMDYETQLEYKQSKVVNCLKRIGGVENAKEIMEPIIGMEDPYYYRNKVQLPVGRDKNGRLIAGFFARRTHAIVESKECVIQNKVNDIIMEKVLAWVEANEITLYDEKTLKGMLRYVMTRTGYVTGQIMVVLVVNAQGLTRKAQADLVERLSTIENMASINVSYNKKNTNVIMGDVVKCIYGTPYIEDYIGDVKFKISAQSFYQVNPVQTVKLYNTALEYAGLDKTQTVWDLYCGIGTISLFLAKKAKMVYGVEIVKRAVKDAQENALINGIENAQFFAGAAESVVPAKYEESNGTMKADVVVVDPPRKGCDAVLIDTIAKMEPQKVVYVSCDPATLARDIAVFSEKGYECVKVRCTDMFPGAFHVETVALLSRQKVDEHI